MRITNLNLHAFGPFTGVTHSFPVDDRLVVLYGPNEAGKSSTLRALRGWLYGVPGQSTDNFLHENKKIRVGGTLRLSDGREFPFVRRKGNKNTVLDLNDNPLADGLLETYLSNIGEEAFATLFGIDNDALVKGGREILQGKGDLGEALFAAGMSGLELQRIFHTLEEKAGKLFKAGGSKQTITESIRELNDARRRIKEQSVSGNDLNDLEARVRDTVSEVTALDRELAKASAEFSRLERLGAALPKLAKRTDLIARLEGLRETPLLPEDFPQRRRDAQRNQSQARVELATCEPALNRLGQHIAAMGVVGRLVPYKERIESLFKRLGAHTKAEKDLLGLETNHASCVQDANQLLERVRPGKGHDNLALLRVTEATGERIRELALQHLRVVNAESVCMGALGQKTGRLQDAEQAMAAMPDIRDEAELERTLDVLQKYGDLEKAGRMARKQQHAHADEAVGALARLGLWSGTAEEIECLPVPPVETIDRFQASLDGLTADLNAVGRNIRDLETDRDALEEHIEGAQRTNLLFAEEDLSQSRHKREEEWQRVRGVWLEQQPSQEPGHILARTYEQSVTTADKIADGLRENADQVAEQAERKRQLARIHKKLEKELLERVRIEARHEQLQAEWTAIWSDTRIQPLPPREMQAWLKRYLQLMELVKQTRLARAEEESVERDIEAGVLSLNACLGALGEAPCAPGDSYGVLVERCKALVLAIRNDNSARTALGNSIAALGEEIRRTKADLKAAADERAQWQLDWTECMTALELPSNTSISEVYSHLETLNALFARLEDARKLKERIISIKNDADCLHEEVAALLGTVAPDLGDHSLPAAIEELHRRLGQDQEAVIQLKEHETRKAETQAHLDAAKATLLEVDQGLARLCREASCEDSVQLESIEHRAMEHCRLSGELDRLEEALLELSMGMPVEKLVEEASAVDGDQIPATNAAIREHIERLRDKMDEGHRRLGALETQISAMQDKGGAAAAAETAQQCLAVIDEEARQYIKLKMASVVLRAEIKKYQTINQGPLMERAEQLFNRLTLGSFHGLGVGYNEKDEPYLYGIRPTEESVPVEGMSDGTRDQLYLSLRLATLDKYLENNEPMPFIVDDILIRFDDDRARATLNVLAELAKKTQVLFLTHHARLFEFAKTPEMVDTIHPLTM